MIFYGYLYQIAAGLLALWMLKVTYFFIKRRYTKSSVVDKNSAEESDIYTSSENVYNESSLESLNLEHEKELLCRLDKKDEPSEVLRTNNLELMKFVDTDMDNKIYCDLVQFDSTLIKKNIMDINNVTVCSGNSSTEDEMQESNDYTTSQDVLDTCKLNSDSHSSIISWESCNKEMSHTESLENHTEICQPLNLCIRDRKNKTGTNKISKTHFTDRKYKSTKGIQKVNSGKYLITETIEDYDQCSLDFEKMKNLNGFDDKEHSVNNDTLEYNKYLEISKLSSIHHEEYYLDDTEHELKTENHLEMTNLSSIQPDEYSLDDTEHELKTENHLEMTNLSSIQHDEYSLDDTEHELKTENHLEMTNLSSIQHDEYSLDDTEHELKTENHLEMTNLSSIQPDEYSLDDTEHELKTENHLEMTNLSSIQHDEYSLDDTENELKTENHLEMTELSSVDDDKYSLDDTEHELKVENNLEITELSSIHHEEMEDKYSLDDTQHSLNNDDVMLVNNLETTGISPIQPIGQHYEYNLESPERSFFNNDISISGICSPNIKCNYDYAVQDSKGFNNTSSSEYTESFPSPIFNNDSSIDDIRYVEDYKDISFFDPMSSDDAMNEAFVED